MLTLNCRSSAKSSGSTAFFPSLMYLQVVELVIFLIGLLLFNLFYIYQFRILVLDE